METSYEQLREILQEVFKLKWHFENAQEFSTWSSKFVFHMSDASKEICDFAKVVQSADGIDVIEFSKLIHRFFLHAVPHLMAAGELYDYIPLIYPEQRGVHTIKSNLGDEDYAE
jgi:hypothetical protein